MSTPAGWYPQPDGSQRYWDGARWTPHTTPPPPPAVQQAVVHYAPQQPAPGRAVTKSRKDTSHTFHLIMTVITGGLWGVFVWLPMILWHSFGPRAKAVTRYR